MKSLQEDIKNKSFRNAYLLYGEEAFLRQQYRKSLLDGLEVQEGDMNFSRFQGKNTDVREVISLCETLPFLAERRVILLEDTGFFKNKCDELADYMKNLPEYLCLVFSEETADRRSRMYKAVTTAGRAVEFRQLDAKKLMEWAVGFLAKNGRRISRGNAELLISRTGTDMGSLRMELEKLVTYTEGKGQVNTEDIEAICTVRTENRIFDMIRAVANRDQKRALALYDDLLKLKEPPMRILFLLARQFRQMLLVLQMEEDGYAGPEIAAKAGVQTFVLRQIMACARTYSRETLREALRDCLAAEEAVKTGRLQDTISVELLLIKYSRSR